MNYTLNEEVEHGGGEEVKVEEEERLVEEE